MKTCEDCRSCIPVDNEEVGIGLCHHYPPKVVNSSIMTMEEVTPNISGLNTMIKKSRSVMELSTTYPSVLLNSPGCSKHEMKYKEKCECGGEGICQKKSS